MTQDPLHTKLCDEYGCEVPIVAFSHTKDVVVAVTNAGGIGVFGALSRTPDELDGDIDWIKERVGDRPFGVDLVLPASFVEGNKEDLDAMIPQGHRDFVAGLMKDNDIPKPTERDRKVVLGSNMLNNSRAQLRVVFEHKVPILASALGSPAFILDDAHAAGAKVWGLVGLPRQAQRQIDAGVDVVIAQGYDAGGHSSAVGTFTLVPEVVRLAEGTGTIILAAGGVSSGKHLAASLAMGAQGVWTGTIWLATHESSTELFMKQRLIDGRAEDAVQTRASSGKPMRQIRSKWSEAWAEPDAPTPLQMPLQPMLVAEIEAGVREGRKEDWMYTPAGQSIVGINKIQPAAELVFSIVEEAQDQLERLGAVPVS